MISTGSRPKFTVSAQRRPSVVRLLLAGAALNALPLLTPGVHIRVSAKEAGGAAVATGPQLMTVSALLRSYTTTIMIETSDPVPYVTGQPDPFTLNLDLRNARAAGVANNVKDQFGVVAGVTVEEATMADGVPSARVKVRLTESAIYNVRSLRNIILVEIGKKSEVIAKTNLRSSAVAVPASAASPSKSARGGLPPATRLSGVSTALERGSTVVTLSGNGHLAASNVEEITDDPRRVVVDFPNVTPTTASVTEVDAGPIDRIRVAVKTRNPLVTRVVVDLNRRASYRVQPPEDDGDEFRIVFDNAPVPEDNAPLFAAQVGPRRPAPLDPMTALTLRRPPGEDTRATPTPAASPTGLAVPAPSVAAPLPGSGLSPAAPTGPMQGATAQAPAPGGQAPAAPPQAPPQTPPPVAPAPTVPPTTTQSTPLGQPLGQARTYSGHPVVLDFQGADLRAVLRTFQEISGLNMVIDPAVQGTVDVALRDVPWDQALDIILRANKLGYVLDGTIVRIAPLSVLADEEAQRRRLAEEQALAGELRVFTRSLSYAKAEVLAPLLIRSALTARGEIQVDPRTNTLIIRDLPNALQTAGDLIGTLDRPEPQVDIEARIVQTTREFARSIGVQWGFNGRVAPDLGNTTGLAFPNQGSLTGRTGQIQGALQGEATDSAATAVNLGVDGAANAIGLALGSVNGAVNLDVALSALERSGQGRLLSTPRVSTQNNVEAEITQGVQIPIQTVANNTVTVTFKDAALTLKVTPQITAANTVIMRISVENASPDFSRSIRDIPPIDTQRAITQVLVSDGQTTVIGGIYVSREQAAEDRTPGLHRLPLLGWLFKRESIRDESRELLIFITPRIIRL